MPDPDRGLLYSRRLVKTKSSPMTWTQEAQSFSWGGGRFERNHSNVSTCRKNVPHVRREVSSPMLSAAVSPCLQLYLAHSGLSINICCMNEYLFLLTHVTRSAFHVPTFGRGMDSEQIYYKESYRVGSVIEGHRHEVSGKERDGGDGGERAYRKGQSQSCHLSIETQCGHICPFSKRSQKSRFVCEMYQFLKVG